MKHFEIYNIKSFYKSIGKDGRTKPWFDNSQKKNVADSLFQSWPQQYLPAHMLCNIILECHQKVASLHFLKFGQENMVEVLCLAAQSCPILRLLGLQPTRLLCPWGFSRQEYWGELPRPSNGTSQRGDQTQVPLIAGGFLTV